MSVSDWRTPRNRAKQKVVSGAMSLFRATGRYRPIDPSELKTRAGETVHFIGDIPAGAGQAHSQNAEHYVVERPACERLENIIYTPQGHVWQQGALHQKYSLRAPGLKDITTRPRPARTVASAYIIESETPYTYGDWVGDFIRALVELESPKHPVFLPQVLAQKSYVVRDLERLGLKLITDAAPVRIKQAHVLRKTVPSYYWGPQQVAAYRKRFEITLTPPKPGSLIYLSREGIASEAVDRTYPSQVVAQMVRDLGGTVFDTAQASPEAFAKIADQTETVIADQGSAIFGVLQWQTKALIEITTEHWWHSANLFFAKGAGVSAYGVMVCDRYRDAEVAPRLHELLAQTGFDRGQA